MSLAERMNGVPDRAGWFYGVIIRHGVMGDEDRSITVSVHHRDGRRLEFEMPADRYGVVPSDERHATARAVIDA